MINAYTNEVREFKVPFEFKRLHIPNLLRSSVINQETFREGL